MNINILPVLLFATMSWATPEVRTGLLGRLVKYYKEKFLKDLVDVAPVPINVSIEPAPPGYTDSSAWDYDSVTRLLNLLRRSEPALSPPVRESLREFLTPEPPSRRYGGMGLLHKARQRAAKLRRCLGDPKKPGYPNNCPKGLRRHRAGFIGGRKNIDRLYVPSFPNPNDLYYDEMIAFAPPSFDAAPDPKAVEVPYNASMQDTNIVVISNPVEAKLPSGHISIGQLRRILEARAEAARVMPTIPTSTMLMVSMNKTGGGGGSPGNSTVADDTDAGNSTLSDGGGNATVAGAAGDAAAAAPAGDDAPAEKR